MFFEGEFGDGELIELLIALSRSGDNVQNSALERFSVGFKSFYCIFTVMKEYVSETFTLAGRS